MTTALPNAAAVFRSFSRLVDHPDRWAIVDLLCLAGVRPREPIASVAVDHKAVKPTTQCRLAVTSARNVQYGIQSGGTWEVVIVGHRPSTLIADYHLGKGLGHAINIPRR